jgi:hypothetical protein
MQPINYSMEIQDPSQAFLSAFQTGSAITKSRLDQEQAVRQAEQQQRMTAAFERLRQPGATAKDYADLAMQLPETQAKAVRESFSMISQEQQQNALMNSGKVFAAFKAGQPEIAINLMEQQIAAKRNSGDEEGAKFLETWRDVTKENPQSTEDYFGFTLSQMPGGDKIIDSAVKLTEEQRKAQQFPVLQKQKQAELAKATSDAEIAAIEAKYAERIQQANLKKVTREINQQAEDRVQSSSIRPDGTVVIVTSKGNTRVIGADGVELVGDARVNAVRAAEEFGADIQGVRAGARISAEGGQKAAIKAFEVLEKTRENLGNLDNAIAALDAGATTGVIANKFPNWKASTIELQNIQNRLGLDIIGSVTFGALSEGELSLALQTALPLNMNEKQLRDWLVRKKDSQTKLANYVSDQARFLTVPGRNLADWEREAERKYGAGRPGGQMEAPGTAGQAGAAPPAAPAAAPAGRTAPVRVTTPTGQVLTFPNQQAADAFKRAARIQ